VLLELGWTERLPPGAPAPRLDVEMNGYFLATLPKPRGSGEVAGRARLRIPREHMRGFNQLLVHVHYPEPDPCGVAAGGSGRTEQPRVAIAGDSVLHVEGLSHFASLPDVSLFAYDGFPFTLVPDLGDSVVVLPDSPAPAELSAVLSIFAQLAQVTGRVGTRAAFVSASRAADGDLRDKDLLVVGGTQDNALVSRWGARLPVAVNGPGLRAQRPWTSASLLELLGGVGPLIDLRRAGSILERTREVSAIAAIESPVSPGRTAIFVTGTSPARLPPYDDFLGYAESRTGNADLLLLADGQRWLFRVGTSYGRGQLDAWTRLRWFLATHWMALLPVLVVGVAILAHEGRRFLARRIRERLAAGGPA
jgi:cellulose synthase (UDP-forming)